MRIVPGRSDNIDKRATYEIDADCKVTHVDPLLYFASASGRIFASFKESLAPTHALYLRASSQYDEPITATWLLE